MKFVNRLITAGDQRPDGVREGLVFPHKLVKGLQSTKKSTIKTWTTFGFYTNLFLAMSTVQLETFEGRRVH